MRRVLAPAILALAFGALSHAQQPSADLILTNGKIITVDDRFTIAQAVAIIPSLLPSASSTTWRERSIISRWRLATS